MSNADTFDAYDRGYAEAVAASVSFSGLRHDFFLKAKTDAIIAESDRRYGQAPLRALDVGCGVGSLHPWLKTRFELSGTDVSTRCLEEAHRRHPEVAYTPCSEASLPHVDAAFDVLTASCVLHHVPVGARPGFAAELRRVVRAGGLVAIAEHNPFNPLTRLSVLRCPFDEDAVLLRARSTERLLQAAGFRNARSQWILLLPSEAAPARAIERVLRGVPLGAQYVTFAEA